MLSDALTSLAIVVVQNLPLGAREHLPLVAVGIASVLTLIFWRIWRFTIVPFLEPDDPRELPYWIPCHGGAFFRNSNALLTRARVFFNNTDPFALTIANSVIYVITKPEDVAEAYRNTATLSFNEFVQAMMRACGNSEFCVQAMYTPLPKDKDGFPNPHGKPLATLARHMHMNQLYPGDHLDFLEHQFMAWFDPRLTSDGLREECPYAVTATSPSNGIVLPLMEWCSDYFTRAGQRAYFGPAMDAIDPTLPATFIVFDELSWQVLYQYPDFLATEMKSARDTIQRALKKYIQIPQRERNGDAWFTKAMENEMRALGINEDDIATMLVTIYWGINTNTRKAAFWLLTYILNNGPEYINLVRKETLPAFQNKPIDLEYLHDHCPHLDAMWNETIRLSAYSASVRFVTSDTVIGGKILRKGNRLMIPYRPLHFDESTFSLQYPVNEFRHERFLQKSKNLTRSDNWRPFGGGTTMCPGRYVAKRSVLLFVAMLLQRFNVELVTKRIPEPEEGKPVLGIMSVKEGEDVLVRVWSREVSI
ncbi:cytochrome P450 [Aspergillus coremiiformis]|uniref:Cytochrome P450 n=1 Tax=Aspergillus coremiiformis TaxID=138285 RepID=A0A5N6Z1E1_9EURO|nr:cytochrome P450 [Aspergillus coremiiformis]